MALFEVFFRVLKQATASGALTRQGGSGKDGVQQTSHVHYLGKHVSKDWSAALEAMFEVCIREGKQVPAARVRLWGRAAAAAAMVCLFNHGYC